MFSIVLVVVAIIAAYICDTLPRKSYNEFDNFLLERRNRSRNGKRIQMFQSFILAMSDQQLVSGLALVIAINVIRNGVHDLDMKIAGYAFTNAVILAFFSCIIHLATIAALRDYLRNRGFLKHLRVAIMICVLALLLQGLGETWTMGTDMKLRCSMEDRTYFYDYSDTDTLTETFRNASNVLGLVILRGILGSGYIRRILDLYFEDPPLDKIVAWLMNVIVKKRSPTLSDADILEVKQHLASKRLSQTIDTDSLI